MKHLSVVFPLLCASAGLTFGQSIETRNILRSPATDQTGASVIFPSNLKPDGTLSTPINLYYGSSRANGFNVKPLTTLDLGGVAEAALSKDGSKAVYILKPGSGVKEEVHVVDTGTGADRLLVSDSEGCILPAIACISCMFTCLRTPHLNADGSKALYTVARSQPFYVADVANGGSVRLPIYSGALAASPQRVISSNGKIVFTSNAPSGPTFAAQATDVYLANLDGSGLQNVTKFGSDASIYSRNAVISSDGNTIVFISNYFGGVQVVTGNAASVRPPGLWAIHADGTGLQLITSVNITSGPALSADGTTAAYISDGKAYLVKTTANAVPVAVMPSDYTADYDVAISDDGSHVVLSAGQSNSAAAAVYEATSDGKNLTAVYNPRTIFPGGVSGAAGVSAPAPGALISVYGSSFSSDTLTSASTSPLPTSLAGVSLLINGRPAPLLAVTPWQINAQAPPDLPEGPATFQVRSNDGSTTAPVTVSVKKSAPAAFTFTEFTPGRPSGHLQAAAFHAGTTLAADPQHPAKAGEVLEVYATGLGATVPPVAAGQASPSNPQAVAVVTPPVTIGRVPAQVLFAGLTPGYVGLYQVNIVVPSGLAAGTYTLHMNSDPDDLSAGEITIQ